MLPRKFNIREVKFNKLQAIHGQASLDQLGSVRWQHFSDPLLLSALLRSQPTYVSISLHLFDFPPRVCPCCNRHCNQSNQYHKDCKNVLLPTCHPREHQKSTAPGGASNPQEPTKSVLARLLKAAAPATTESVTTLINKSIVSGKNPTLWKLAKITPIHK